MRALIAEEVRVTVDLDAAYRDHAASLCRAMHALTGSRQLAEDLVQDTFAYAVTRRHELLPGPGLRCWLYRVAVNRMRHRVRGLGRFRVAMQRLFDEPQAPRGGPEELMEVREHGRRVHAAIGRIPEVYREVFVLFELQGLSGAEVAEVLGLETATVWTRLHRGRKAFTDAWNAQEDR